MPNTNVLDEARSLVSRRLTELDDERKRLERALAELGAKTTSRPRGRSRGSTRSTTAAPRRRGGNTRAKEALELIGKEPGISASDIAKAMKIKPNYLYRVLGDLEKEKQVKKDGRQYYPAG